MVPGTGILVGILVLGNSIWGVLGNTGSVGKIIGPTVDDFVGI